MTPSIELTRPKSTAAASDVVQTGQQTEPPGPALLDRFSIKKIGLLIQQFLDSKYTILFGNTLLVAGTFALGILLGGPIGGTVVGIFWGTSLVSAFGDYLKAEIESENRQKRIAFEYGNHSAQVAEILWQNRHCSPREVEWHKRNLAHARRWQ